MLTFKEELTERAQLVRIHEANCEIECRAPAEAAFRLATTKKLASEYSLRELRDEKIADHLLAFARQFSADGKPVERAGFSSHHLTLLSGAFIAMKMAWKRPKNAPRWRSGPCRSFPVGAV
jgi:hypothetical protein